MPDQREQAILVGLELKSRSHRRPVGGPQSDVTIIEDLTTEESLAELRVLAESAGAEIASTFVQSRDSAEAATVVGTGKVEEIAAAVESLNADVVLFDRDLSPTQQRNLERALHTRVVDRTQLILDIFASRARTREGQMQVELAQLNYLLPRLAGRGVQMSRLGGGIGTRGPGETQLETDRRKIHRRIRNIEAGLERVRAGRSTQRRQRQAVPLATVGLVGYTNAGKSTLFNRLTGAGVVADARMFATLDPTVRQFTLPSNRRVLVSDTVGFIRNLPTTLVKAFRATLEEVKEAALLLHVVDASAPHAAQQTAQVMGVLKEIGCEGTPQLLVLNKVDALEPGEADLNAVRARVLGNGASTPLLSDVLTVSARTGDGLDKLLQRIDEVLPLDPVGTARFRIPHTDAASLHILYEFAKVLEKRYEGEYAEIVAEAPESVRMRLKKFVAADA